MATIPPGAQKSANLVQVLEASRRDLLDLGLRNPLLNYRQLKARGIEIVYEKTSEIFRILVREEKSLTFLSGTSSPGEIEELLGQPENGDEGPATRHTDLKLQTSYTSPQLQARLLGTFNAARTSLEEQGVNTLFMALGMLNWRDADASDQYY